MKFEKSNIVTIFCVFASLFNKPINCSLLVEFHIWGDSSQQAQSCDEEFGARYIGAVLEYEPYDKFTEEGQGYEVVRKNAKKVVDYAVIAKSYNADILVTPENGLPSLYTYYYGLSDEFLTFTQYVPDPTLRKVVCNHSFDSKTDNKYEAIEILSCGALKNKIYIIVNVAEYFPCSAETVDQSPPWNYEVLENCPQEGFILYNTQVVFDRNGAVIARFRKINLYQEPLFSPGLENDTQSIFVSDFNVAFSLQICFDILHKYPGYENVRKYGIRDILMSTAWLDILPFHLAVGVHSGWSRSLGVNLLLSGFHLPEGGLMGSGIYKGYSSDDSSLYVFDDNSGNTLLISTIDTIKASCLPLPKSIEEECGDSNNYNNKSSPAELRVAIKEQDANRSHTYYHEDLSHYTKVLLENSLNDELKHIIVCSRDAFCCEFSYKYNGSETYYLLAYKGQITLAGQNYVPVVEICAIVWCYNSSYETCGYIEKVSQVQDSFPYLEISSNSFSGEVILPITTYRNQSLIGNDVLDFEKRDKYSFLKSVKSVENLFTVALHGRKF